MTTAIYVGHDGHGHRAYRSENGITREWVGPPFASPADAIAYAAKLRGIPSVQATRSTADGAEDSPYPPSTGSPEPVGSDRQVSPLPSAADPDLGDPLSLGLIP